MENYSVNITTYYHPGFCKFNSNIKPGLQLLILTAIDKY